MKDKTYDKWISKTVKRSRDGMYGQVVESLAGKMGRTWWLVAWRDGSRKAYRERDMIIVADGESYPETHAPSF